MARQAAFLVAAVSTFFMICNQPSSVDDQTGDNDALRADAYEANDGLSAATRIARNDTIAATVHVTTDVDCYRFVPLVSDRTDSIVIYVQSITGGNASVKVELLDVGGNTIASIFRTTPGTETVLRATAKGDSFYVRVSCAEYNFTKQSGAYRLAVGCLNANESCEPNGSRQLACELAGLPVTAREGLVINPDDSDYYAFRFESPQGILDIVDIHVANGGSDMAIHLAVYDSLGNRLISVTDATEGADVSRALASRDGRYYVLVTSDEANFRKRAGPYTLSISSRGANDAYEPNDSFESATVIDAYPVTVNGTVLVDAANDNQGDYEFFVLTVRGGKRVTFTVDPAAANTEMHFDVYNASRARVGGLDGGDGQTLSFYLNNTGTADGVFYVRLGAFVGDNGNYQMTFVETDAQ